MKCCICNKEIIKPYSMVDINFGTIRRYYCSKICKDSEVYKMEYKKITQKKYLSLLSKTNKSLIISTFQDRNSLKNCFDKLENLFKTLTKENITECFKEVSFIKLISGSKKRMVFKDPKNSLIYGDLSGNYYLFSYLGFDLVINTESDECLKTKNFKLYTLNLSFIRSLENE